MAECVARGWVIQFGRDLPGFLVEQWYSLAVRLNTVVCCLMNLIFLFGAGINLRSSLLSLIIII